MSVENLSELDRLIRRLRAPDGCPWDQEQDFASVRAYIIEEAHEVAAAIDSGDRAGLAAELGDLLFQIVFLARLATEEGSFGLADVIRDIHTKMVDRHPHVFGGARLEGSRQVQQAWEKRKAAAARPEGSHLDGVARSLPALVGSYRMTQKAAGVGFDWTEPEQVLDKVEEEIAELRQALASGDPSHIEEEIGDLLFSLANFARHQQIDPEAALARTNLKFRRRFRQVESSLKEAGIPLAEATLEQMDAAWEEAKQREPRGEDS